MNQTHVAEHSRQPKHWEDCEDTETEDHLLDINDLLALKKARGRHVSAYIDGYGCWAKGVGCESAPRLLTRTNEAHRNENYTDDHNTSNIRAGRHCVNRYVRLYGFRILTV